MRSEDEIVEQLKTARQTMQDTTSSLSSGHLSALDFTGIAGTVGIIQALEWVLEKSEGLELQVNPLRRPLEDI
ncbi:MAG: hypothetical protein KAT18_06495 [Candidatus Latescibacteria bacterium]|nr:hypothetical protein [Candidatus Latescibacterota bacterium]